MAATSSTATPSRLRVTTGGKLRLYVSRALEALPVRAHTQQPLNFSARAQCYTSRACLVQNAPLTIAAEGAAVAKAVSVAEITKRRLRGLHQNTQIGLVADAARSTPTIAITLSRAALDTTQPGYARQRCESE